MCIESATVFAALVERIRELLLARTEQYRDDAEIAIKVPGGPIEHW